MVKKAVEQEQSSPLKGATATSRQRMSVQKMKNGHSICKKGSSVKRTKSFRKQKRPFISSEKNLKARNDVILLKAPGKLTANGENTVDSTGRLIYTKQTSQPESPRKSCLASSTTKDVAVDLKIVQGHGPVHLSTSSMSSSFQSLSTVPSSSSSLSTEQRKPILKQPTFKWTSSDSRTDKTCTNSGTDGFSLAKFTKEGLIRKPVFDGFKPLPPPSSREISLPSLPQNQASFLSSPPVSKNDSCKKTPLLRAPQFTPSEAHFKIYQSLGSASQSLDSRTFGEQSSTRLITQKMLDSTDSKSSSSFCFPRQDQEGCSARKPVNCSLQSMSRYPSKMQSNMKQDLHRANHLCLPPFAQLPFKKSGERRVQKVCGEDVLKVEDVNGSGAVRRLAIKKLINEDLKEKHLLLLEGETFLRNSSEVTSAWSRSIRLNGVDRKMFSLLKRAKVLLCKIDREKMETDQLPVSQTCVEVMETSAQCESNTSEVLAKEEVLQEENNSKVPTFQTAVKIRVRSSTECESSSSEPVVTAAEPLEGDENDSKLAASRKSLSINKRSGSRRRRIPVKENPGKESALQREENGNVQKLSALKSSLKVKKSPRTREKNRRLKTELDEETLAPEEKKLKSQEPSDDDLRCIPVCPRVSVEVLQLRDEIPDGVLRLSALPVGVEEIKPTVRLKMKRKKLCQQPKSEEDDIVTLEEPRLSKRQRMKLLGNAQKGIPHICQFCGNAFSSKHHLAQHTMFKHPDPLVKKVALRCSRHKHVKDLSQVLQNTESVTEKVENKPCFLIEGKLYSANESDKSASVLDHSVMEEKPHVCKNCGMLFSDLSLLNKHKQTHRGKRIACTECGKLFTSSHHVKRHQVVHTGEKPFDCTDCGKRFSRLSHVRRHRLIHTGEKPFKCDQCDKGFSSPSHVKRHYVTHTGEKPFFCTDCGKRFTRLAHLQRHQQGHRDPPLHKCTRCEKCFKNDLQLKRHLQRHENCLQNCPECGRPFFNLLQFNQHMLKHVKKKSFVCTECKLCYKDEKFLQNHMKIHKELKPYKCTDCEAVFIDQSVFLQHQQLHLRESECTCRESGKIFKELPYLTEHNQCHEVVSSNTEETFSRETGSSKYSLRKTERKVYAEDDELQDEDYLSLTKEIIIKVEPCDTSLSLENTVSR